jgi:hypothetical protein
MTFKIISARYSNNKPIPKETVDKDLPEIQKEYVKAVRECPTWGMFGGDIFIESRRYFVSPC